MCTAELLRLHSDESIVEELRPSADKQSVECTAELYLLESIEGIAEELRPYAD